MNVAPFDAGVVSRLINDQPVEAAELAAASGTIRPLAAKLAESPLDLRPAIVDGYALGLPKPADFLRAIALADRDGPAPVAEPKRLTANLGDLAKSQAAGRFVWQGWIVKGHFNLLSSDPKIGKTHVCLDLARRIYAGLPWPDGQPATFPAGTPTLWVCGDRHQDELRERAAAFGLPPDAVLLNASPDEPYGGCDLDDAGNLDALRARVVAERPALVMLDTVWRSTRRRMHVESEVNEFMDPILSIAQECDTTILGLMHLSKGQETLGRRLEGLARAILKLFRPDPGQPNRRKLTVIGNFKESAPLGVTMQDAGCDYDFTPPDEAVKGPPGRPSAARDKAAMFIREALTARNDRVATELCSEWTKAGGKPGTFWNARDDMVSEGTLVCEGTPKVMHLIDPGTPRIQEPHPLIGGGDS